MKGIRNLLSSKVARVTLVVMGILALVAATVAPGGGGDD